MLSGGLFVVSLFVFDGPTRNSSNGRAYIRDVDAGDRDALTGCAKKLVRTARKSKGERENDAIILIIDLTRTFDSKIRSFTS